MYVFLDYFRKCVTCALFSAVGIVACRLPVRVLAVELVETFHILTMRMIMLHPQRRSWWSVGPGARAGMSIVVPSCPRARALASRS